MKTIEKYDFYKDKYPYKIVFIKEGIFYKTFKNDSVIIWNLFRYKWNNESIAFGESVSKKVFEELQDHDLGYVVASTKEETTVDGVDEVYILFFKLSKITFDKYNRFQELNNQLNFLLGASNDNYDKIKNFFDKLLEENYDS